MNHNKQIDIQIRKAFHQQLAETTTNPWFTKKVMNSLPDKANYLAAKSFVALIYFIVVMAIVGGWIYAASDTLINGFSISTLCMAVAMPMVSLIGVAVITFPAIRRAI